MRIPGIYLGISQVYVMDIPVPPGNGQEDPYITLLRYEIVLSPKIETILRQLGFFSFAIIQEIDLDIHILERDIQFLSKQ